MKPPIILSLFDFSGHWPKYFKEAGYEVHQVDEDLTKQDVLTYEPPFDSCYGLLAAPPCTHFSVAGRHLWAKKDIDGKTAHALKLVDRCFKLKELLKPNFFILENPSTGRLKNFIGNPKMIINPFEYANYAPIPNLETYKKATGLWGNFELAPKNSRVIPFRKRQGLKAWNFTNTTYGSARSVTPLGFAKATYLGNRNLEWEAQREKFN